MPSETPAISITNLSKRYGAIIALDAIDLDVPAGTTYGFLGPNGAGKTTAIRVLLGFIRPTAGTARIWGRDCWHDGVRARADVGYLVPADAFYPDMPGRALLDYAAQLSGKPPVLRVHLLNALELGQTDLKRRLKTYSKGMKQKLALTAALQTNPALLVLDEPTEGLDPLIQRAFEDVLADMRRQGTTVFMSSHDLAEVERTCERVAIIRDGRIVAKETIGQLKDRHRRRVEVAFTGEEPAGLDRLPGIAVIRRENGRLVLSLEGQVTPLLRFLADHDDVTDVSLPPPRLEDIFLGYYETGDNGQPEPTAVPAEVGAPEEALRR